MKNYWMCVVEVDIPDGEMPFGADSPLRQAVEAAVEEVHKDAKVITNSSGWGLSAGGAIRIREESCKTENRITEEDMHNRHYKVPLRKEQEMTEERICATCKNSLDDCFPVNNVCRYYTPIKKFV